MPLFRRSAPSLSSLPGANTATSWTTDDEWHEWEGPFSIVRGEASYADALYRVVGGGPRPAGYLFPVAVTLRREPSNPYDPNAIRAQVGDELVGYIAREIALELAPGMDRFECPEMKVAGIVRGGSSGAPNLGVHVWPHRRLGPGLAIELSGLPTPSWPPKPSEVGGGPEPTAEAFPAQQVLIDLLPERIAAGLTVCFTGNSICRFGGRIMSRRDQEVLALSLMLTVSHNVTKQVDLLVVSDLRSASGKAQKAREYGTHVMHEPVFWHALGFSMEA